MTISKPLHASSFALLLFGGLLVLGSACGSDGDGSSDSTATASSPSSSSGGMGSGGMGSGGMGTGGMGTGGMGTGGIGPQQSLGACDDCMDAACSTELAACAGDCVSIEACLETVCRNITDATQEGLCQVYCQGQFAAGKQAHLDVVNCTITNAPACTGCLGYDTDYPACREAMLASECKAASDACEQSVDCKAYRDCTGSCSGKDDCVACSGTASAYMGRELLQAVEFCIAKECINESWEVLSN
jgi:hypothetical protein